MINSGVAKNSKGEVINTFMQFGNMDPCGCFGWSDCPICHFWLLNCDGEKVYTWGEGEALVSGGQDAFDAAVIACKGEPKGCISPKPKGAKTKK